MCRTCRDFNEEKTYETFSKYNIDLDEYLLFTNSVFEDLSSFSGKTKADSNKIN